MYGPRFIKRRAITQRGSEVKPYCLWVISDWLGVYRLPRNGITSNNVRPKETEGKTSDWSIFAGKPPQ